MHKNKKQPVNVMAILSFIKEKKLSAIQRRICQLGVPRYAALKTKTSELHIKQTVTNMFITFSVDGSVVFSCSAGSAGLRLKERRMRNAIDALSEEFCKYVRFCVSSNADLCMFSNIIVVLNAPVVRFRSFLNNIETYISGV